MERTVAAKETSLPTTLVRDTAYRQGLVYCDGKVSSVGGVYVCGKCGRGAEVARSCAGAWGSEPDEENLLECALKRNARALKEANNILDFDYRADPEHVPAWKKRRRA